jgi:uncharacterized protein (TIGR02646 family)
MRYIKKSQEPPSFTQWKQQANLDWQPTWNSFQAPQKNDVHDALLKEQGKICCYCGIAITRDRNAVAVDALGIKTSISHIEHLKPRSKYPDEALVYENLLASCQGEREENPPYPYENCGTLKDEWYDEQFIVSPLNSDCASFFSFTGAGEMLPTEEPEKRLAAQTTIDKLGLNISKLIAFRRKAVDGVLTGIEDLSAEELQLLAEGFNQPDQHGQLLPFCAAIAYILKTYL